MEKIAIIGVGVVGLELAVRLSQFYQISAYNINQKRVEELKNDYDKNHLISEEELKRASIHYVGHLQELQDSSIFIIVVPTDIHQDKTLDLEPIKQATQSMGEILKPQDIVIFESSVYPKFTEELLIPILEEKSGLKVNQDFFVAYCPERFSPQDADYELHKVCKVISASHPSAVLKVQSIYQKICASTYIAPNMAVAECSKMLENIQRNVNIALMNEFSIIMHALNISLHEVIQAASTKKNFLPFQPGLVGGYCIPVNPFYFMYQARKKGIEPSLIQAAETVNESMPSFLFSELLKLYFKHQKHQANPNIAVFGLSFKPNIPDIRHSLSLDFIELMEKNNLS
ncbi:MAG: UDP-N-acetyl-D-glucosamine/UDP-N-acetyl-D-galactosamine dehydrogenase, partial [Pseudomonadota bacterium]|nr:UDP-N-acetyl-D-glucosamine/UDP-N-acetyl-D-galactosamine dehydrogenase [Pseudomonadota bacterium]